MEKSHDNQPKQVEQRKYIRLNAVFPVEFQLLDPETGGSISGIKQGFTRDVGKGGICLEVNNVEDDFGKLLEEKAAKLDIRLHIPLSSRETKAVAVIAWHKKVKSGYPNKYFIGVTFLQIDPKENSRIYFHARRIAFTPKIVSTLILLLIVGLGYFYSMDFKLRSENKKLVRELVEISGKKSEMEKNILETYTAREKTETDFLENQKQLKEYQDRVDELEVKAVELRKKDKLLEYLEQDKADTGKQLRAALVEKEDLYKKVTDLSKEAAYLKQRIVNLSKSRVSAEEGLDKILASFRTVEEKSMASLYKWIKNHQNNSTGLVISYEGDDDLKGWSFVYDQSLACQCFMLMGDRKDAEKILNFYKNRAKKIKGAFANAYDADTGSVLEYNMHVGPNVWLGIAILQYTNKFKDDRYLSVAEDIAKWVIILQKEDKDFGIRGGPDVGWYSTEHNLDAYAFFGMLYELTGDRRYFDARERALSWIRNNAFNRREGRLNRGKGDATIATDTFAWAVAAIGPQILKDLDMDPDQVIDFAETNCLVTVDYARPDGEKLKITGFDFGKYEHLARGGIVSTEWTAQMVVTLKIMAKYHKEKNEFQKESYYKRKADFYLSELEKMVIVSPSRIGQGEGCLPYASQDNVDTGHGWKVAHGSRTGSTAGTGYTIFAKYGYNPLMLKQDL